MCSILEYEAVNFPGRQAIAAALERNDPAELLYVPLGASLHAEDRRWAEQLCARLATHADPYVRGNAVLGFGHLARRFHAIDWTLVEPLLREGLRDAHPFVRGQANAAADDNRHFTGRVIRA